MQDSIESRIDSLYLKAKSIPKVTLVGLVIPVVLLALAVMGLVWAKKRSQMLALIDSGAIRLSAPDAYLYKIEYVREHKLHFFLPIITLVLIILGSFVAGVVLALIE